jgi:hypothetical protein
MQELPDARVVLCKSCLVHCLAEHNIALHSLQVDATSAEKKGKEAAAAKVRCKSCLVQELSAARVVWCIVRCKSCLVQMLFAALPSFITGGRHKHREEGQGDCSTQGESCLMQVLFAALPGDP